MKKYFFLLLFFSFLMIPITRVEAQTVRQVINLADWRSGETWDEGILRITIHEACRTSGNDIITFVRRFEGGPMMISLYDPLVIPQDCQGTIELKGLEDTDVILDGRSIPRSSGVEGESCILMVYSNNNLVTQLSFIGHNSGAGVCLFGENNQVQQNNFGITRAGVRLPNRFGVVLSNQAVSESAVPLSGSHNLVRFNRVSSGSFSGVIDRGNANTIQQNNIENPLENGIVELGSDSQLLNNTISASAGRGIVVEGTGVQINQNQILEPAGQGIYVKGENNMIQENTVRNAQDEGMDIRGNQNQLLRNTVEHSEKNGLLLIGSQLLVRDNNIKESAWSGIWVQGHNSQISFNRILANGGCPFQPRFLEDNFNCISGQFTGGPGILINEGSTNILVGGASFERDRNIIQFNGDGGVIILGDATTLKHNVTHNTISKNYGPEPDLDLLGDGLTSNDLGDTDNGPNSLLNFVEYIQAFPLTPSSTGNARYWTWGLARSGARIELYGVSSEDRARNRFHGGGDIFFGESDVMGQGFRIQPSDAFNSADDQLITALSFDRDGNTSEYAYNTLVGQDSDLDGIIDSHETNDGTPTSTGTVATSTDTDHDGLPDSVEDRNRNGVWDISEGETSAYNADSDSDGLNDWVETHGDGIYHSGIDTNPLDPDTDHDGLLDGREDSNSNGVWDNFAGETSPLIADSDRDGVIDSRDNCGAIPNPTQEAWMCLR